MKTNRDKAREAPKVAARKKAQEAAEAPAPRKKLLLGVAIAGLIVCIATAGGAVEEPPKTNKPGAATYRARLMGETEADTVLHAGGGSGTGGGAGQATEEEIAEQNLHAIL
jgi:hypothetical protein